MDLEDEIEQNEIDIDNIDNTIDKLEDAKANLEGIEEFDDVVAYIEEAESTLRIIKKYKQQKIEDIEEQNEYVSDREERTREFERSAI